MKTRLSMGALLVLLALVCLPISPLTYAQKKPPCKPSLAACPDEGCGTRFDPNLNRRKNIRTDSQTATVRSLTFMKKLDDPENFSQGETREELTALGEGQIVTVTAFLLEAKAEGAESCNCGLTNKPDTDNHLVLVSKTTVDKFPVPASSNAAAQKLIFKKREAESITAEFTPRVRLAHPNFTRAKLQPFVNKRPQRALLVRVTGALLFDSEHFIRHHLVRVNNWEIHPVLKLEFCETNNNCRVGSDAGWKSLDDLP